MNRNHLQSFHFGLERETLRIDSHGNISKNPHPKDLGSPLTHPYISTDFSEQQLEWNTPAKNSFNGAKNFLEQLMRYTLKKNPTELFWPFSMPPHLEAIEIAQYGTSHQGLEKVIYREGLRDRYGINLQMISGIHYNLSFGPPFWKALHREEKSSLPLQKFINEKSLGLIRNFLREGWLLTYLFGASPLMDPSYSKNHAPFATSIRTSSLGYYSRVQNQLAISFNSLEEYIDEMTHAITTPKDDYRSIQSQLNPNLLQIENEHYSRIRPKAILKPGETPLEGLQRRGIDYVEVRAIDLDPYHPIGISREQIECVHIFLLYCLIKKSPPLTKQCQTCLTCNQDRVALEGRKEGLMLQDKNEISLQNWGLKILRGMEPFAQKLGQEDILTLQKEKLKDPGLILSSQIMKDIERSSFLQLGTNLAKKHAKALRSHPLTPKQLQTFDQLAKQSLLENKRLETASEILVKGYEDLQLSTQILIRKALEWNIQVDILDREDQFLRLEKNGHVEYVKEATKTSKDPYIVYHLLENKQITKDLLKREGLSVPEGESFSSMETAFSALPRYLKRKCVIKPKEANFGLGVNILSPHDEKGAHTAIKQAFSFGSSVLIEAFCPGEEYRFLIIDNDCIGVAQRVPAHVVGDGTSTIQKLVHAKNHDPSYYRDPKTYLRLGPEEKKNLQSLRLRPSSIPKKGKRIFLRHNSNVSTGGDALDKTDDIHPGYAEIALQATRILGARICGVDMLIPQPKKAPTRSNYTLIELNYNPVLFIHAYPYKGMRRDVASPLLQLLGFQP